MKIVVKERGKKSDEMHYLVYLMTERNVPIKCELAVGEEESRRKIFDIATDLLDSKIVEDGEPYNLNYTNYDEVKLEDFLNKKLLNEPTYG